MKRRSDISKLVTASRNIWRQSQVYQAVKKFSKDSNKSGWFICAKCLQSREVIKIDHIESIGKQPDEMYQFGDWLPKLFCDSMNLQAICVDCHKEKSKNENRLRRCKHKKTWFDKTITEQDLSMHTVCSDCGKILD